MGFCLLSALLLSAADAGDVDLSKLPRKIAPPKDAKVPKYCCLVFGEKAERIVWLALEGESLFVDRNSDGDFDDADERIVAKTTEEGVVSTFAAGDLSIPKLDPAELTVTVTHLPKEQGGDHYNVRARIRRDGAPSAESDGRYYCLAYEDKEGPLVFAPQLEKAPMLHFGGPWTLMLDIPSSIARGREAEVYLSIGTKGVGPGSLVMVGVEDGVPKSAVPTVRFLHGGPSVSITHRC
jgi:hypothetical protein